MSRMPILVSGRLKVVDVTSPRLKRLIGQYWGDAVAHFLETGDTSRLLRFRRPIAGVLFETDPEAIEDFFLATDFDFQEIYEP